MKLFFKALLSVFLVITHTPLLMATVEIRPQGAPEVVDFLTARDLELVGSVNEGNCSVAQALDKTKTKAGAQLLRSMLVQPLTNQAVIMQRQSAIKALVDNPALREKMEQLLSYSAVYQDAFTFFNPATTPESLTAVIQSFLYQTSFLKEWNESTYALDTRHVSQSFSPLITAVFEFLVLHYAMEYLQNKYGEDKHSHKHGHKKEKHKGKKHDHEHGADCGCIHHAHAPAGAPNIVKALVHLAKAGHIALHLISIKDMVEFISAKMAIMNQVYQQLSGLQVLIDSADQLQNIQSELGLKNRLNDDVALMKTVLADGYFSATNDNQHNLHLFSPVGQTLVTYAAVQQHSEHLERIKQSIAQMDVYCSIARLMFDAQDKPATFCFVDFIQADSPQLVMEQGWHVMLDQAEVVPNNFIATAETALKFTLTGPNRSGKSSFLRTLGVNVALAQIFGIAAAKRFSCTIFNKILSFITITDDLSTGKSSYVARMMRADGCMQMQKELQTGSFALVLLDDSLGQATSVELGERMAYDFTKEMGASDQNILVCATHIAKLTNLAKETKGRFANIRMKIVKNAHGRARETYMLESGLSDASDAGILVTA